MNKCNTVLWRHPLTAESSVTPRAKVSKTDGRKRRWREHKLARREELVDGTLDAIRVHGSNVGMDQIAAEIGVSKTVLYRYFTDKNDLTNAAMERFVQTILAPRIYEAIGRELDEYGLARAAISAYVETIASDTAIYLYVMSNGAGTDRDAVADSEKMIAELVHVVITQRLAARGHDTEGASPWAYGIVGAIQLAVHSWISHPVMPSEQLIDYLTMMIWSAIEGIARSGGSREVFNAQEHPLPPPPGA